MPALITIGYSWQTSGQMVLTDVCRKITEFSIATKLAMKKLWGGRFKASTNEQVELFTESVSFDQRLAINDIKGSLAHARMLAHQGIISSEDFEDIAQGLNTIQKEIESGTFQWSSKLEDVHMNIESRLTELKGDAGKRLHTGRSRNDQVSTDIRLYLRTAIDEIIILIDNCRAVLAKIALEHADKIMPGFTHMQAAQPTTIGHHLLAWQEMFRRDRDRLVDARKRLNLCPLGAAALCGTSYPIDRQMSASELGFDGPTLNSLDSVSDRDFAMEFLNDAAIGMVHLSRMSEELVLWSSPAFDFVDLGDAYCTGSSIMPQKKNPDIAELIRGKSARIIGNSMALLTLMKGQPLAYNRDNQEDKEPLFDTLDHWSASIEIFSNMMAQAEFKFENMRNAAEAGYSTATDFADYLVKKGMPFRDAHEVVGNAVAIAVEHEKRLDQLTHEELLQLSDLIDDQVYEVLSVDGSVSSRNHIGGTAPNQVRIQAQRVLDEIN